MSVSKTAIEAKRIEVISAYSDHGLHSVEYQTAFDDLHTMKMSRMAAQYRRSWGLGPLSVTPYCEAQVQH